MALPKALGDIPTKEIIPKDVWTKAVAAVNTAKIHNNFGANQTVWMTYVTAAGAAPVGLDIPIWKVPGDFLQFTNSSVLRDVYLYAVDKNAEVTIES